MNWTAVIFTKILAISGLVPFATGTLLAGVSGYPVRLPVFGLGLTGAALLMAAGLAGREAWAPQEGGWPGLGRFSKGTWRRLAYILLAGAAALGVLLQFGLATGDLTLPMGALGVLGGYFSFAPPLALGRRGWGEAAAGLCFGLLPVLAGYYLQCGHLISEILVLGLPSSLAAANLFLVYGASGEAAGPRPFGLAARLSAPALGLTYTIINVLTIACLAFYLLFPANPLPAWPGVWLAAILALGSQKLAKRRAYRREDLRGWWRGLTLALYITLNVTFLWSALARL